MSIAIPFEKIEQGYSYAEYRALTDQLLSEGKTTGDNQSEAMIEYTQLNVQRMKRAEKVFMLNEETEKHLQAIDRPIYWVVLSEAWCGDAALNLPAIAKMAEVNDHIKLSILLRDENPEVMDQYLTNGGRSIPKLIAVDAESGAELFTWGPRPAPAQQIVLDWKASGSTNPDEKNVAIQKWYAKDKGLTIQEEFIALLNQ
ncbi:thioredoxin family protein [Persicobacter diffluens]|uniref:Thioredoxin n=1 Tax=Persicobacter diffluens TaxID=981 RepID=A0AAN4VVA1_9BACT|nr:thioredoxin [Persicobacter diffluens]